jgi:hypothetical protein
MPRTLRLPAPDARFDELVRFASKYNAYERWVQTPERLEALLAPISREWEATGRIPSDLGVDALRALLFYEYRADYFAGGSDAGETRMRQVVEALRRLENAAVPEG